MKKALVLLLGVCFLALFVGSVVAKDAVNPAAKRLMKPWSREEFPELVNQGPEGMYTAAQQDTYCIVWYDFEQMNWQGWTRVDNTAQVDTFFHVDDFAGLGGGDFGLLVAPEGDKAMWCGARPDLNDPYMCSWVYAPGYGNAWNQMLVSDPFQFAGIVRVHFKANLDSEPDYDFTYVEIDAGGGDWQRIGSFTGTNANVDTILQGVVTTSRTKIRFHFTSDGAWSDQDGLWNTDGGAVVDAITIFDDVSTIDYEDFESAPVDAKDAGIWHARPETPYGMYSGLINGLEDKDPCGDNFTTQVVFFIGSPNPSSEYPGLYNTPFCAGQGGISAPCQDEMIVSPIIDLTKYSSNCDENQDANIPSADLPELGGALFLWTVYRDLPVPNLVFYVWHVRNIDENDCPGQWLDRNYVYYGAEKDYIFSGEDVSDLITEDRIQLAVGAVDMCDVWYLAYGNCAAHTPSPWFDNVRFYRYKTSGPQWTYRMLDIFQDNFPSEGIDGYVRADAANDILPNDNPNIRPGDSIVVGCSAPLAGGLALDGGWPAIYMHVRAVWVGPGSDPGTVTAGSDFEGTFGRYVSDDGTWVIIQGDSARTTGGIVADKYMFDLNDSLFVRGYRIDYYFRAVDQSSKVGYLPSDAPDGGYFEFTCLPTGSSDILYVDDFHGRGGIVGTVERYFNPAFEAVLPADNQPDRYDVNSPSSMVSNGPASRASLDYILAFYKKIIWDSGNLQAGTICDGSTDSDKSDDVTLLNQWMDNSNENNVGLWILGDGVAYDLANRSAGQNATLLNNCGVVFVHNSYYEVTGGRTAGGVVTPLVTGLSTGIFYHSGVGDDFYVFGGCPIINSFDCLDKTTDAAYALKYPDYQGTQYYAGIQKEWANQHGRTVRTVWFGFSFMYIRDDEVTSPIIRNHILKDVIEWFENTANSDITGDETGAAYAYKLGQNYPNPFNPTTTIKFSMKAKGHVSIKIYNVAGQLVKNLVDGVYEKGPHSVAWDGTNNLGAKVASGVYFYKMETKDFSQTKKMVLLR